MPYIIYTLIMGRKRKTDEEYGQELIDLGLSIYNIEEYIDARTPILHECMSGHNWKAVPNVILQGSGCPECFKSGLQDVKLYHISLEYEGTVYYKIGISNQVSLARRFRSKWHELKMKVIWEKVYNNRYLAKAQEQMLLYENHQHLINLGILKNIGGDTETLIKQIEEPA